MTTPLPRRSFLIGGAFASGAALAACSGTATTTSSASSTTAMPVEPSPNTTERVSDAEQAGSLVAYLAMRAAQAGSYGIAGAIIENATGRVVHAMENTVLKRLSNGDLFTYDPTAHGERQLAFWYFANKTALRLPESKDLTVVTSLDPCAMCTGTLLTSGFNVGVVAMDTFSGINYQQDDRFTDLPPNAADLARATFGYYAVENGRNYAGGLSTAFRDSKLTSTTFADCETIYQDSATNVRNTRSGEDTPTDQLTDPSKVSAIVNAYRAVWPAAFSFTINDYRRPNAELKRVLEDLVKSTPGAKNAVAFIDTFGNVVLAAPDTFDVSPVHTAFMNVSQGYATTRFNLMNDAGTQAVAKSSLVSPKWGTFVWLYALDPGATTTIEDLGAYGSTVESKIPVTTPSNFQYFNPPRSGTEAELKAVAAALPPLYSQLIQINPERIIA